MHYYKLMLQPAPQTQWTAVTLIMEMAFGAIGGGMFLAGLLGGNAWVCTIGFLLATACKGFLLLKDLGKPERCLRVLLRPFSSWMSFGAWALGCFGLFGFIQIVAMIFSLNLGGMFTIVTILAGLSALVIITYDGLLLTDSKAVAAWESGILVPLFACNALACGCAVMAVISPESFFLKAAALLLLAELVIISVYLVALHGGSIGMRKTWGILMTGSERSMFVIGTLVVGIILPLILLAVQIFGNSSSLIITGVCALMTLGGVYCMRASILKSGVTTPAL